MLSTPRRNFELAGSRSQRASSEGADQPDISVLLVGKRLQITADVDGKGLVKLKQVLAKYEEILKMLQ